MNVRSIDNCECAAHLKRKLYKKKKVKWIMVIGMSGVQFSLLSWVINKIGQLHSRRQIITGLIMNVITDWIRNDPKPSSQQHARAMVSPTSCKLHIKSWWKFENK